MAEERDPLVSRRYRELGSEEPPADLDARILARSRRRRSFQWHGPVAAAAVIVLAVAVTVHVERERPQPETVAQARIEEPQTAKSEEQTFSARNSEPAAAPPPPAPESPAPRRERKFEPAPPAPEAQEKMEQAARPDKAPAAGAAADSASKPAAPGTRLAESRLGKLAEQAPERWLEGIAELRGQGRHEEADESLKRFRERYPDHQISEETKAKIERR